MIYVAELGEIKFSTNVDFAVQAFPFAAPFAAPEETQHPLDDGIYYYDSPPPGFAMDAPPGRAAPAPDGGGGGEPADGDDPVILGWATDDDSSSYAHSHSGSDAGAIPVPLPASVRRSARQPQQAADPNDLTEWGSANPSALSAITRARLAPSSSAPWLSRARSCSETFRPHSSTFRSCARS